MRTIESRRRPGLALLVALLATTLTVVTTALGSTAAHADTSAVVGDESVHAATGWWSYTGQTGAQVANLLTANGARLTDIEVDDTATPKFTVTMVKNSGAYAVSGWWWYYGVSAAQVASFLSTNHARLITLTPYSVSGTTKYAVIMVSNQGAAARSWWWYYNVTPAQVSSYLSAHNARLVDMQATGSGSAQRLTVVMVSNTGADAKAWQWWYRQTAAQVNSRVSTFGGRLVSIDRTADGLYDIILVKQTGTDNIYWRYYYGIAPHLKLVNLANQYNLRIVDITTYTVNGSRKYDAIMIDNVSAEARRVTNVFIPTFTPGGSLPTANFGFYLKKVGGGTVMSLMPNFRYEPASAIKAVHNLTIMREIMNGTAQLTDLGYYYQYPNSIFNPNTSNACPDDADEIPANKQTGSNININFLHDVMMANSDNRATRYFAIRYGLGGLQATANLAGMSNTTIGQARIGCGELGGQNRTTMADLGKLYEGIENGTTLNDTNGARAEFYQPMITGVGNNIKTVVNQEAAKLGKTSIENQFFADITAKTKGGSYNNPCSQITNGCSGAFYYYRDFAGKITIPFKSSGRITNVTYVWGHFIDLLKLSNGASTTPYDNIQSTIDGEMLRSTIHAALATW